MDDLQLVGERDEHQARGRRDLRAPDPKADTSVAYHGPLDDRFNRGAPDTRAPAKNAYVAQAIDEVLAHAPVANPRVADKVGQTIAFPGRAHAADFDKISYSETVAPILQKKCVTCHQKGGIGPFQMNSYSRGGQRLRADDARDSDDQRIPPFFADPPRRQVVYNDNRSRRTRNRRP